MFRWFRQVLYSSSRSSQSDFASITSHELRTPLSIVKWYTEILLDEDMGPLNEDQKKYLRVIESSNERSIALVTALLNVSRLELGTFSVSPEPLLFTNVLEEVLKKQEPKISKKKVTLTKEVFGDSYTIPLDKGIVTLIIRSILENAISFSKEGGRVEVAVSYSPSLLTYTVKDTGVGIKSNEQEKLFTKMFRGSNVQDDVKGSGLSLYIAKTLLSKVGGTLFFSSKENEGSTFTVNLPATGMRKRSGSTKLEAGLS